MNKYLVLECRGGGQDCHALIPLAMVAEARRIHAAIMPHLDKLLKAGQRQLNALELWSDQGIVIDADMAQELDEHGRFSDGTVPILTAEESEIEQNTWAVATTAWILRLDESGLRWAFLGSDSYETEIVYVDADLDHAIAEHRLVG